MVIVGVLIALAAGQAWTATPGWATAATVALQVVHSLPQTRRWRSSWTLAAQAALSPWSGLPGFLAGSILLIVPRRRLRWVLFASVVAAAGAMSRTDAYDFANAMGNTVAQGLVIYLLTRLDEVRSELHVTRGRLTEESVRAERERSTSELETTIGGTLTEIIRLTARHDVHGIVSAARSAAQRARHRTVHSVTPDLAPTELTPRQVLPIMVVVHVVYLVVATVLVLRSGPTTLVAAQIVLLVTVVALQLYHSAPRPPTSPTRLLAVTLPVEIVLACLPMVLPGTPYPQLVGLAAGAALIQLHGPLSWTLATALVAAVPVVLTMRGLDHDAVAVMTAEVAVMAVIFYGITLTTRLVYQVHEARRDLAEIAVTRERHRIAHDVHDLLGQGIAAILLKAEMASRSTTDGQDDLDEIADLARRALGDLRAIPSDDTEISLDTELRSAREVLGAAGTATRLDLAHGPLHPRIDRLLATVLREAATNVLRHSRAHTCVIETGRSTKAVHLRLVNDVAPAAHKTAPGQGIANLAERVAAHGGTLTTSASGGSFELVVRQPVDGLSSPTG